MDGSLVPFLPAVMVAVEQLEKLGQLLAPHLAGAAAPLTPEAGTHLAGAAAAVSQLEADRCAAHQHLEAATIENTSMRERVHAGREHLSAENLGNVGDVVAARAAAQREVEALGAELQAARQRREDAAHLLQDLLHQNHNTHASRQQLKAQRELVVAALSDVAVQRRSSEEQLEQTRASIEELEPQTAAARREVMLLEESMALERAACPEQRDALSREEEQVQVEMTAQKKKNRTGQRELDKTNKLKGESLRRQQELESYMVEVGHEIQRLRETVSEQQLGDENKKQQKLQQQIETLKELMESGKHLGPAVGEVQQRISMMERKIEEGWASKLQLQDTLSQIWEELEHQRGKEVKSRAEHGQLAQQLEQQLGLQLDLTLWRQRGMASAAKHRDEIRVIEEEINQLVEEDFISRQGFTSDKEELCREVEWGKLNLHRGSEEMNPVTRLLEETQKKQEEHEAKMRSDIGHVRRRHEELLLDHQQRMLRLQLPEGPDLDLLMSHMAQSEKEQTRKESSLRKRLQKCITETERTNKSNEEKQKETEEKEDPLLLKELEDKCDEEESRAEGLKVLTSEQSRGLAELQRSSHAMEEGTGLLMQPRAELQEELAALQRRHLELLEQQASELRAVELSLYEAGVYLQQVGPENRRLHLSLRSMEDELLAARQQAERDQQLTRLFSHKTQVLLEGLQEV
ncbi:golgin subfamily A member 6-like protein 7 [Cololabis saira]|uniref:golgin subfamily A member 6-like protein 7 n=1 Tax=Cololabis saira TaxID=129043 RepID=UPI002AD33F15|nr:golgin subfamily A member 6-like protein 7 [Cololabis saira]